MMKKSVLGMLILSVAVIVPISQAAIVTNGSFEAESFGGYGYATGPITGWTYGGAGNLGVTTANTALTNGITVPDGSNVLFMQGTNGTGSRWVSQNMTLSAGVTYTLSYYESGRSNQSDLPYLQVTLGSQSLGAHSVYGPDPQNGGLTSYTLQTVNFTVPMSGTYALKFANNFNLAQTTTWAGETTILLDNIQIVPEPVSMVLMGLGGLVFLRRRS